MSIAFSDSKHPYIDLGQGFKVTLDFKNVVDKKHLDKAEADLRETPEIRDQGLNELRELIKNEKNFVYPTEDFFLYPYLRPCKFYATSAFKKLKKDLKFKCKHKEIFADLTVESVRNPFEDGVFKYTPLCDKNGQRILAIQCGKNWILERSNKTEMFRAVEMYFHSVAAEPMTQIYGVSILLDMEGLTMNQVMQMSPSYAATIMMWLQEGFPLRLKKFYVVNNSKVFNVFYALFAPFISAKLKERVHILNQDFEALGELMGKDCLPKEYGGDLPVDFATGTILVDFLKFYEKFFELKNIIGVFDEKVNIEDKRKEMNACATEILKFVQTSSG